MSETMNRKEAMEYLTTNFSLSGEAQRIIDNILYYVELQDLDEDQQYNMLSSLLDGIGLTDEEIKRIAHLAPP